MTSGTWDASALADPGGVWFGALPVTAGALVLMALVVLFRRRKGASGGTLLGTAVALASIPATLAIGVSTDQTRRMLTSLALTGPEGIANMAAESWSASRTLLWGSSASLALLVLSVLLLALGRKRRAATNPEAEAWRPFRGELVLGLPLLPMLLAALAATHESRISRIVLATYVEPLSAAEGAALKAELEGLVPGSTQPGVGAILLISETVARRVLLVEAGALLVCGLLLAAAAAAAVLGWRARATPGLTRAGFALILLGLMGSATLARSAHARMQRTHALASETPVRWQAREARFAAREAEHVRACQAGDAGACSRVAEGADERPEKLAVLDTACTRGVMAACGALGWLYTSRSDSPEDRAQAAALLQRACAGGHRESCTILERYHPTAPNPGAADPMTAGSTSR